jgi:hypothetical protein
MILSEVWLVNAALKRDVHKLTFGRWKRTWMTLIISSPWHVIRYSMLLVNFSGLSAKVCLHVTKLYLVSSFFCCYEQIVNQCNEGARKMANLEQIMEIDKIIDFKATRVIILY